MSSQILIVGAGLTGSVIARCLVDSGREVLVLDRRDHLGGNVHDSLHVSGIRIHTYGPHYFRTNDDDIWQFVNRFARFSTYRATINTFVGGRLENWPIASSYVLRTLGAYWQPAFRGQPINFEEASLSMMPRSIYDAFVKGYTEKQWGVPANSLSSHLARRFDVRADDEPKLSRHKYQGIPEEGYAKWMIRMLDGINVILGCDYLTRKREFLNPARIIFTGPLDEYFGFDLGKLQYRGQQRDHKYFPEIQFALPCGQVNNPDPHNGAHIRTLEWRHMMPNPLAAEINGTVLTRETPFTPTNPNDFEYPFPDDTNRLLAEAYKARAKAIPNLMICGRLGEYRYYDMDQSIARAILLAKKILS